MTHSWDQKRAAGGVTDAGVDGYCPFAVTWAIEVLPGVKLAARGVQHFLHPKK